MTTPQPRRVVLTATWEVTLQLDLTEQSLGQLMANDPVGVLSLMPRAERWPTAVHVRPAETSAPPPSPHGGADQTFPGADRGAAHTQPDCRESAAAPPAASLAGDAAGGAPPTATGHFSPFGPVDGALTVFAAPDAPASPPGWERPGGDVTPDLDVKALLAGAGALPVAVVRWPRLAGITPQPDTALRQLIDGWGDT